MAEEPRGETPSRYPYGDKGGVPKAHPFTRALSAADAKNHFSEVVHRVAYGHERVIIERRGKPLAAIIGLEDLRRLEVEAKEAPSKHPQGLAACAGLFADFPQYCDILDKIVEQRQYDHVIERPPPRFD